MRGPEQVEWRVLRLPLASIHHRPPWSLKCAAMWAPACPGTMQRLCGWRRRSDLEATQDRILLLEVSVNESRETPATPC